MRSPVQNSLLIVSLSFICTYVGFWIAYSFAAAVGSIWCSWFWRIIVDNQKLKADATTYSYPNPMPMEENLSLCLKFSPQDMASSKMMPYLSLLVFSNCFVKLIGW